MRYHKSRHRGRYKGKRHGRTKFSKTYYVSRGGGRL